MDNVKYKDEAHEKFYSEYVMECRHQDAHHKALVYCLGMNADTRRYVNSIYNFKTGSVIKECLNEGWITSGSGKVVRMAFNLYNNGTPSIYAYEDLEDQLKECSKYTVEDLFCCPYAKYFFEAIKIRYPEFCT